MPALATQTLMPGTLVWSLLHDCYAKVVRTEGVHVVLADDEGREFPHYAHVSQVYADPNW